MNEEKKTSDKVQNSNNFISDVEQRFSFGKYKGETVLRIIYIDPNYFEEIKHLCSDDIYAFAGEIATVPYYVT